MGGLRKYMPITYWTRADRHARADRLRRASRASSRRTRSSRPCTTSRHAGRTCTRTGAVLLGVFVTALYTLPAAVHDVPRRGALACDHAHDTRTHVHTQEADHEPCRTVTAAAREPWVVTAARAAGDPVGRHRLAHDRAAAVRRLLRRLHLRAATSTTSLRRARRGVPRPARSSRCTAFTDPVRVSRRRRRRARVVPVPEAAGPAGAARCAQFAALHRVLVNKYYFDWFNENVLARRRAVLGHAPLEGRRRSRHRRRGW